MLARKQELNTQLQQLIDALLLAVSLWVACVLRFYATSWFRLAYMVDPFRNYQWFFVVIMPFGPIMLDLQGFYQSPLKKSLRPSRAKFSRWGPARSRSTARRSGSISRFYCTLVPRPSPDRERSEIPSAAVATIRSKYLAKMSNSRFTGSPG